MPYPNASALPSEIKSKYAPRCQRAFVHAFNSAYETGGESKAFAAGHAAAKRCQQKGANVNHAASAAGKLPDLGPGGVRFVTNSLTTSTDGEGRRRFKTVGSSTITDRAGNTITLKALQQLRDDYRAGRNIFMDHDYENVVDKVFGMSDSAEIVQTTERDPRTGQPIYDLIVEGPVNEPNPRAIQLADSIDGGYAKFGASIGAIIRSRRKDKETGGWIIDSISGEELSIVGIPKNQRSWAYKAALAAEDMEVDDDEGEEEVVGEQPTVVTNSTAGGTTTTTITTNGTQTVGYVHPTGTALSGTSITVFGEGNPTDDLGSGASPEPAADPASESDEKKDDEAEATPGGQEADAATPETAPEATEVEADPPVEEKAAFDFEGEDVVALLAHMRRLVEVIGERDREIESLKATIQNSGAEQVSQAQDDLVETIRRVSELPLQRRAVGFVQEHVEKFSGVYDPRVISYIERVNQERNK